MTHPPPSLPVLLRPAPSHSCSSCSYLSPCFIWINLTCPGGTARTPTLPRGPSWKFHPILLSPSSQPHTHAVQLIPALTDKPFCGLPWFCAAQGDLLLQQNWGSVDKREAPDPVQIRASSLLALRHSFLVCAASLVAQMIKNLPAMWET